ncbi:MAG: peptidylprolyl isomerase, partial [Betaproteobacteria bacterium]
NGVPIPQQRVELLVRQATQQGNQQDGPQLRALVRDALINREIIAQEAMKSGIAKKAEYLTELEAARQQLLLDVYMRDYVKTHPITDAEVQKEYDRLKSERGDRDYKVRHILLGTEDEAKSVIADLKKGTKFDDLARKLSKDEGTKSKGGDLDWVSPGAGLDKDFANALVKLTKGKHTEAPVKSRFGYHVIQLDDSRTAQFPPLSEVKANLTNGMQQQRVAKHVEELRAKAKVE